MVTKDGERVATVVFLRKDSVGLAFTVERGTTGNVLLREDAEEYALR